MTAKKEKLNEDTATEPVKVDELLAAAEGATERETPLYPRKAGAGVRSDQRRSPIRPLEPLLLFVGSQLGLSGVMEIVVSALD